MPEEVTPPESTDAPSVTLSQEEYTQFKAMLAAQSPEPSKFDEIKTKQQAEQTESEKEAELIRHITFDHSFDSIIDTNQSLFSSTAKEIRASTSELKGAELTQVLSVTAAKSFFSNEDNVGLLSIESQEEVRNSILDKHDRSIDADRAWALVGQALHIQSRLSQHRSSFGAQQSGKTNTPKLDAFWDNLNTPQGAQ
jgi:hypothetical protein